MKTKCSCGNEVKNIYEPNFKIFEYAGIDKENNPVFRCKRCGECIAG